MCHSMGSRFFLRSFPAIKETFVAREKVSKKQSGNFSDVLFLLRRPARLLICRMNQRASVIARDWSISRIWSFWTQTMKRTPSWAISKISKKCVHVSDCAPITSIYWFQYTKNITVYADSRDTPVQAANAVNRLKALGTELASRKSANSILSTSLFLMLEKRAYGDRLLSEIVDVIETSDLDRNMDSQFHGYFNINRYSLAVVECCCVFLGFCNHPGSWWTTCAK